jgi:hypothetical protein
MFCHRIVGLRTACIKTTEYFAQTNEEIIVENHKLFFLVKCNLSAVPSKV